MPAREPRDVKNLDRYGHDALPWSRARDRLAAKPDPEHPGADSSTFLSTTRPDGRVHTAPVGTMWHEGDLYFTSGDGTRKSRNLAVTPTGTLSIRLDGIDVVLEGEASRVTDPDTLEALARAYRAAGWPVHVEGEAFTADFSAPSAGPPPWPLYQFRFTTVFGVATAEPWGATRWRFAGSSPTTGGRNGGADHGCNRIDATWSR